MKTFHSRLTAFTTILSLLLVGQAASQGQKAFTIRTNYHALVLYYNPDVWKDGQLRPYRQTYGARDIDALCADYIRVLKRASGGQVTFDVAYRYELKEFPPDNDPDVTFTSENYHELISNNYDMWGHGHANYVAICEDPRFGIVQKVEAGLVDAIWIFPPNNTGFWETAMAGQGAYWVNGAPYPEVSSSRKFVLYGFGTDGHQGVGYMLENTAHMTELIMGTRIASNTVSGATWPYRNTVNGFNTMDLTNPGREPGVWKLHDWDYFTCSDGMHWDTRLVFPGHSQAGLSHFPPTACFNYGWDDPRLTFLQWEAENILYLDGTWTSGDRVLVVSNTGPTIAKAMLKGSHDENDARGRYRVPIALTDFDIEAGVMLLETNATSHAGITFRFSRYADGSGGQDGYYVGLQPGNDRVQLYRLGPSTGHTLISEMPCDLEPKTNYTMFLSVRGSNVTVRLDPLDTPVLSWSNLNIPFGGLGLGAGGGGSASFSHVNVTPMLENYAETWRSYPNLQGPPRRLSSDEWAGDGAPYTDMDGFYAWWYEHLPKNPGAHLVTDPGTGAVLGNRLNTWWPYIFDINVFDQPYLPPGSTVAFPLPDITPPEAPSGLAGIGASTREILLEWNEPADNIGVTRYEVYRDGALAARVSSRSYLDRYLAPGSSHEYFVVALDGSANTSQPSSTLRVTTGNPGEYPRNGRFEQGLHEPLAWSRDAFNPAAIMTWEQAPSGRWGSRCGSIRSTIPNHALWIQEISGLVPSGRYLLTAWIKGENISIESGGSSGASIGSVDRFESQGWLLAGTFDWIPASCFLTADGVGRIKIALRLGHHGSLATGTVWFDDVSLEHAPVAAKTFSFAGTDPNWIATPPGDLSDCVALSAGDAHVLAIKLNGYLVAWGDYSKGQISAPWPWNTELKTVAAGANHSLGLRFNGQVVAWGDNSSGQTNVPNSIIDPVAIAAGGDFSMALQADGLVRAWGNNDYGQRDVPSDLGRVVGISAGRQFAVALISSATVRAWGQYLADNGSFASVYVPPGISNITAIACGHHHVLALLADGTVRAWGRNAEGQSSVPPTLNRVIQIVAGMGHSVAFKEDGTVISWGNVPAPANVTNVFAIAAGNGFTVALSQGRSPRSSCTIDRLQCIGNVFVINATSPGAGSGLLLSRPDLGSGAWTVFEGESTFHGGLRFEVPMVTQKAFFQIKSRPW